MTARSHTGEATAADLTGNGGVRGDGARIALSAVGEAYLAVGGAGKVREADPVRMMAWSNAYKATTIGIAGCCLADLCGGGGLREDGGRGGAGSLPDTVVAIREANRAVRGAVGIREAHTARVTARPRACNTATGGCTRAHGRIDSCRCVGRGHTGRWRLGWLRGAAAAIKEPDLAICGAMDVPEAEPARVAARTHTSKTAARSCGWMCGRRAARRRTARRRGWRRQPGRWRVGCWRSGRQSGRWLCWL